MFWSHYAFHQSTQLPQWYSWTALTLKPNVNVFVASVCFIARPPETVQISFSYLRDILTKGTKAATHACISFIVPLTLYDVSPDQY